MTGAPLPNFDILQFYANTLISDIKKWKFDYYIYVVSLKMISLLCKLSNCEYESDFSIIRIALHNYCPARVRDVFIIQRFCN